MPSIQIPIPQPCPRPQQKTTRLLCFWNINNRLLIFDPQLKHYQLFYLRPYLLNYIIYKIFYTNWHVFVLYPFLQFRLYLLQKRKDYCLCFKNSPSSDILLFLFNVLFYWFCNPMLKSLFHVAKFISDFFLNSLGSSICYQFNFLSSKINFLFQEISSVLPLF